MLRWLRTMDCSSKIKPIKPTKPMWVQADRALAHRLLRWPVGLGFCRVPFVYGTVNTTVEPVYFADRLRSHFSLVLVAPLEGLPLVRMGLLSVG